MDELRFRQLRALRAALDSPFFEEAVKELKREMADEIAECMDPIKAAALRAERFALAAIAGRLETYLTDLMVVERKTKSTEQKTHG